MRFVVAAAAAFVVVSINIPMHKFTHSRMIVVYSKEEEVYIQRTFI